MWLLFVLSVLPSLVLMAFIWKKDKIEKEPIGLLIGLFVLGGLMVIPAGLIEYGALEALGSAFNEKSYGYMLIENFLIVALAEELCKFLALRLRTWKNRNFDYTFDAVVYSVAVSLGFATVENIMYVFMNKTVQVAVLRGVLSVPGHAIDAVFMGLFYGLAKRAECLGDAKKKSSELRRALIVPLLTHGFYDFCLTVETDYFILIFIVFEIFITIVAFRTVNKLSRQDAPLLPIGASFGGYMQQYGQPYQQQYGQPYQQQYGQPNQQQYGQPYQQQYGQPNQQQYGQPYQQQYGQPYQQQYGQPYQQQYGQPNQQQYGQPYQQQYGQPYQQQYGQPYQQQYGQPYQQQYGQPYRQQYGQPYQQQYGQDNVIVPPPQGDSYAQKLYEEEQKQRR